MKQTKAAITLGSLLIALTHVVFPSIEIDLVTVFLLLFALLPWLAPIIKSVELPGGLKVELQDVQAAANKVKGDSEKPPRRGPDDSSGPSGAVPSPEIEQLYSIGLQDPNLALVALRIEIEKRLASRAIALGIGMQTTSAGGLLRQLQRREVISPRLAAGLGELIQLGNSAAHGAEVSREAAMYALDVAPSILAALDDEEPQFRTMTAGAP